MFHRLLKIVAIAGCWGWALAVLPCSTSAQSNRDVADSGSDIPRCQVIPLPNHQASFRVDGVELTRWHFGTTSPRPFLFPVRGPQGGLMTRMGHPGAPNHDHHRSVWFAHMRVGDANFWADGQGTQIRQTDWLAYVDGEREAIMASNLVWSAKKRPVMKQQLVLAVIPMSQGEYAIEFQTEFSPFESESIPIGKSNFGFLAVRVAKSISAHFGGGQLTNAQRLKGEPKTFGKRSAWMDYSGPIAVGKGPSRKVQDAGLTCFDHPDNPRFPTGWHVREDGWMGASFAMQKGINIPRDHPLRLRYLLYVHNGLCAPKRADQVQAEFAKRPGFEIRRSKKKHLSFEVTRIARSQK